MGDVDQSGSRRKGRGLPILGARRGRTQPPDHLADHWTLLFHILQFARFQIHAAAGCDRRERIGGEYLASGAIQNVDVAVAVWVYQNFSRLSLDRKIKKNVFVYGVVVVEIVRTELIEPDSFAGIGIAREYAGRKLIAAGPGLGIPRPRIRRAVIN